MFAYYFNNEFICIFYFSTLVFYIFLTNAAKLISRSGTINCYCMLYVCIPIRLRVDELINSRPVLCRPRRAEAFQRRVLWSHGLRHTHASLLRRTHLGETRLARVLRRDTLQHEMVHVLRWRRREEGGN